MEFSPYYNLIKDHANLCMVSDKFYSRKSVLEMMTTFAELAASVGPSFVIDSDQTFFENFVLFLDQMKQMNNITDYQYQICIMLKELTMESCGVYLFPYWRFSRAAVLHMQSIKDRLSGLVVQSVCSDAEKTRMHDFIKSLNEVGFKLSHGPAYLSRNDVINLKNAIETLDPVCIDLKSNLTKTFQQYNKISHCDMMAYHNADTIGGVVYDVPTSVIYCGRYYYSAVMCVRTEEERLLSHNLVMSLMYAFILGKLSNTEKINGLFNWKSEYLPRKKIVFFCYDLHRSKWLQIFTDDDYKSFHPSSLMAYDNDDTHIESFYLSSKRYAHLFSLEQCYGERCHNLFYRNKELFDKIANSMDSRITVFTNGHF